LSEQVSSEPAGAGMSSSSRAWVFTAALITIFMAAIEATIVATAMPSIVGTLGGFDLFSWVFTAYLLTQAVTVPVYGRLADLYGRKRILYFGIGIFLAGSLLCSLAGSMVWLIVFRIVQGLGAGAVVPVAMTLVGDIYNGADRARMQVYISSAFGSAALLGPLVGALLVEQAGWPAIFWVNIPLGLIALMMLAISLREEVAHRPHRIDYAGSLLMMLGTGLLLFLLVKATSLAGSTIALLAGTALMLLAWFAARERLAPEPMFPLHLLRRRVIAGSNLLNLANGMAYMGIAAFLPAYIQGVMGRSAVEAGLVLTALGGAWPLGGWVAGKVMLRSTFRHASASGGMVAILGCAMMLGLSPERGPAYAIAAAFLTGFGMGLGNNSFIVAVQASVDWSERGVATSSYMFTRILGQAVGTAVFGGILNAALAGHLAAGGNLVDRIMEPALRATLSPASLAALMGDFDRGLHAVYLINLVLALVMLACAFTLPAGVGPRPRPER
jgi:EmrB/QacA subfamily drug resistance transporter